MKSELGIMIQSPFEEFEKWIQKIAENRLPELRKGQFIYNMAYTEFPDQVDLLGYCGLDCFHNDMMIHPFLMELSKMNSLISLISNRFMEVFLRLSEASELLGLSSKTIRRYVNDGSLPSIRTKGVILVPSSALTRMYIETVKSTGKSEKSSADYSPRLHQYFSITEAASAFNIKRSTIEHYFRKRKLKHIKVGHTRYFLYSDIQKLLEDYRPNQYASIKEWYTVEDIMRIYDMEREQVYWFTENHKIPHKKCGKKACYSKVHVDEIKGPSLFDRSQYYQPDEICLKYNLSKDRMYHIVNVMKIPNIRFGREVWILRSAFDSIIA